MPSEDGSEPVIENPGDVIYITGKSENCEAAKQALIDNAPVTIEVIYIDHCHSLLSCFHLSSAD